MKLSRHDLATVIAETTLHERQPVKLAKSIAAYLLTEHRTAELEPLLRDILQYRLDHGIIEAEAVSAHVLRRDVIKELSAMLRRSYPQTSSVRINETLDENLVGGVKVVLPNDELDETVRGQLNKFKHLISV